MKTYNEKDMTTVHRGSKEDGTYEEQSVPKRWVGSSLLDPSWSSGGASSSTKTDEPVEIPEGEPSTDWTGKQLDAYAAAQDPAVDLKGANSKADKLAAIQKAAAGL